MAQLKESKKVYEFSLKEMKEVIAFNLNVEVEKVSINYVMETEEDEFGGYPSKRVTKIEVTVNEN